MVGVSRIGFDGNRIEFEKSSKFLGHRSQFLCFTYAYTELNLHKIYIIDTCQYTEQFQILRDKRHLQYKKLGLKYADIINSKLL